MPTDDPATPGGWELVTIDAASGKVGGVNCSGLGPIALRLRVSGVSFVRILDLQAPPDALLGLTRPPLSGSARPGIIRRPLYFPPLFWGLGYTRHPEVIVVVVVGFSRTDDGSLWGILVSRFGRS